MRCPKRRNGVGLYTLEALFLTLGAKPGRYWCLPALRVTCGLSRGRRLFVLTMADRRAPAGRTPPVMTRGGDRALAARPLEGAFVSDLPGLRPPSAPTEGLSPRS